MGGVVATGGRGDVDAVGLGEVEVFAGVGRGEMEVVAGLGDVEVVEGVGVGEDVANIPEEGDLVGVVSASAGGGGEFRAANFFFSSAIGSTFAKAFFGAAGTGDAGLAAIKKLIKASKVFSKTITRCCRLRRLGRRGRRRWRHTSSTYKYC